MKTTVKTALISLIGIWAVSIGAACQGEASPPNTTLEIASGRDPNASVTGSVTYRERLELSPEATLIV